MPLELGGSPGEVHNLSPESPSSPNPKDKIENKLHGQVCNSQLTLEQAQIQLRDQWLLAYPGYRNGN
jgi:hypothetical protein